MTSGFLELVGEGGVHTEEHAAAASLSVLGVLRREIRV